MTLLRAPLTLRRKVALLLCVFFYAVVVYSDAFVAPAPSEDGQLQVSIARFYRPDAIGGKVYVAERSAEKINVGPFSN
jgi:hypothetical protein